jgi:hypothetical protein
LIFALAYASGRGTVVNFIINIGCYLWRVFKIFVTCFFFNGSRLRVSLNWRLWSENIFYINITIWLMCHPNTTMIRNGSA